MEKIVFFEIQDINHARQILQKLRSIGIYNNNTIKRFHELITYVMRNYLDPSCHTNVSDYIRGNTTERKLILIPRKLVSQSEFITLFEVVDEMKFIYPAMISHLRP